MKIRGYCVVLVLFSAASFGQPSPMIGTANRTIRWISPDGLTTLSHSVLPSSAFGYDRTPGPATSNISRPKVEGKLRAIADVVDGDTLLEVIINFRDELVFPTFPQIDPGLPFDSPKNASVVAERRSQMDSIKAIRAAALASRRAWLNENKITVKAALWLTDSVVATVPARNIDQIASPEQVLSVERAVSDASMPGVLDGRTLINTDWLYGSSQANGAYFRPRIALIDSGSPTNHIVFSDRSRLIDARDCFNVQPGDTDCTSNTSNFNVMDTCNHATSSAAILAGLATDTDANRGVTAFSVGTFKVYGGTPCLYSDRAAGGRAFQAAVEGGYHIIVAEIQDNYDTVSQLEASANRAFDAGIAVIAANGNFGPLQGSVNTPASARKAMGVGAFNFDTGTTTTDQSVGPASGGRFKPDFQAPTRTTVASSDGFYTYHQFSGTSGATPYAGGAAALLSWQMNPSAYLGYYSLAPGLIYAALIDAGRERYFDNTVGAGHIVLPSSAPQSEFMFGTATLANQEYVDIPIPMYASFGTISASIWWPDPEGQHSVVYLSLFDTNRNVRDSCGMTSSVFQKVRSGPTYQSSDWSIRIYAWSAPAGSQTVYWSAHTY